MDPKKLNIVLGIVIVILLGLVGYLAFAQKSENQTLPSVNVNQNINTPIEASNNNVNSTNSNTPANSTLKTYSNAKYGFEFQYPKEWDIYVDEFGPTEFDKSGVWVVVGPKENIAFHKSPPEGTEGAPAYFSMSSYEPKTVTAAAKDCQGSQSPEGLKVSKLTISGISVNKCTFPSMFGTGMEIAWTQNSKIFYRAGSHKYEGTTKADVDTILPTIKILK